MINESAVEWLEKEFEKEWQDGGTKRRIHMWGVDVWYYAVYRAWRKGQTNPGSMMEFKRQDGEIG